MSIFGGLHGCADGLERYVTKMTRGKASATLINTVFDKTRDAVLSTIMGQQELIQMITLGRH